MSEVLHSILAASSYTYTIAFVLTLWAAIIVRTLSESTVLSALISPFIFFGALTGVYACREFELVISPDREANIIATSGIGICVGLLIVLCVGRLASNVAELQKTGLEDRIDPTLKNNGPPPRQPFSR